MENWTLIVWAILGVLLIIAEAFTASFFLFWFGLGALMAALLAFLGFGFGWQFLAFAVTSMVLTALSRTIFLRYLTDHDELKSGVDALPGQIGVVVTGSSGSLNAGEVKVFGTVWTAYPINKDDILGEGEQVEIVRVQGASIYVRRHVDELPGWRKPPAALREKNSSE